MTGRLLATVLTLLLTTMATMAETMEKFAPPTLDIQAGEPLGDAMARSTMKTDMSIAIDMQELRLPPSAAWKDGQRYQLALQTGGDDDIVIPWTPSGGAIWMNAGVIDTIELSFDHFDSSGIERRPARDGDVLAADIEAIIGIYGNLQAIDPRPADMPSCYHNRIPIEFLEKDRTDSSTGDCDRVRLLAGRQGADDLRAALLQILNDTAEEIRTDPDALNRVPLVLNLGQWWLPNANLVMLTVTPVANASADPSPFRLHLSVNIREFFRAGLSRLIPTCHDQQAIFPKKIAYTQDQAAQIFHGLYDDFYPPVIDGKVVTDTAVLALLDWSALTDDYWNDASARRGLCELLQELQQKVGYEGPVAPLR